MTSTDSHTCVTTTWIVIGNAVLGCSLCSITKPFFHFPMGPDNSLINFVHWFLSYIASVYSLVKRDTVSLFPGLREIRRHVRTDIHSYSYWTLSTKLMQITPCIQHYVVFTFRFQNAMVNQASCSHPILKFVMRHSSSSRCKYDSLVVY